jgi:TonB family protein
MEAFATYLMKSSVWLTGFTVIFVLFLRNERFFTLNRIYLVCGMLGSIIFPLFTWHYTVLMPAIPSVEVPDLQLQPIAVVANESFNPQNFLILAYLAGIFYLIFRILRQTLPVFRIIRKSETMNFSKAKLIRTDAYPASFSFFSFVFVNPSIDEIETNEIVNHELEHIRQQHWIDLLIFEILRTVQWFNPAIWLYGHLIRQNHEYLADERALQRSTNPAVYRAALLNQLFGGPVISLANSFNYSLNKKRFNMMKQTISSPLRKLKLLMVLPLIAGVFYAFAAPEYQFVQDENSNVVQESRIVTGKVISEDGKPLKGTSIVVSGKSIGTTTDDNGIFVLKVTDDSPIVVSYVGFESVKINPNFEKEMLITMKRNVISIKFPDQTIETNKKKPIDINNSNALIIVNGNEISKYELSRINPDKIESIDVLKSKTSVEKYGEKGKDGVIEITTEKEQKEFFIVEELPKFPGGVDVLKGYVASTMKYPSIALENGIYGQVIVNFIVAHDGSVTDAKISRGVDPTLDKEALRIVNNMPKWKPGSQNGKPVRVSYSLPIDFKLPLDKVSKEKLH